MTKSLGIYIHIPFCVQKCRYCDFCSFAGKDGSYMRKYRDELVRRITLSPYDTKDHVVDTVYFGGGTPSLMSASDIDAIISALHSRFSIADNAEITLECNPATADKQYFKDIRSLGVNRLSMGLQSASDKELALLGRIHTVADFTTTFADARSAGFDNVSADLMYGIPDQDLNSFEHSLSFLSDLRPEHISAYGLTVESGTYFDKHIDELSLADDDGQRQMYMLCSEYLASRGYEKYEISNFARDGKRSRHNMRYWLGEEYLGFGVASHSFFGGCRFGNSRDLSAFLKGDDIVEERETVVGDGIIEEYIMLRLRLVSGIDANDYTRRFGRDLFCDFPMIDKWITHGFMKKSKNRIFFTDKGAFVSNSLISDMLLSI